jgi:SAM-dependent methyltransferase
MQDRLLSHNDPEEAANDHVADIRQRIQQAGDKVHASVEEQLQLVDELEQFAFGRFMLKNRGLNGYWIDYVCVHPWEKENRQITELERFMLEVAPTTLGTQQRFSIFLTEAQERVKDGANLACIPCGVMGELLYLDYEGIENIQLTGIDYDEQALADSKNKAQEKKLDHFVHLKQADAWALHQDNHYDLITSNGLNIYEPDDNKVTELYRQFFQALKPGGKLITSIITHPPGASEQSEWKMEYIDPADLRKFGIIVNDILQAKWTSYRSSEQTEQQLQEAGFINIEFKYDHAHTYPTVIAYKPS